MYKDLLKIPTRTRTDDSIKAAEKRMASYETSYADDPETKEKMIEVEKSTIEGLNNQYDRELSYLSSTFRVGYKKDKICGFINTKQYDNANFMKYKTTVTEVLRLPMIYPDPKPTSQELSSLSLVQLGEKYCGTGGSQTPTPAGPPAPKQ